MIQRTAYCSGCMQEELVDKSWLALWIDSDGDLRITQLEKGADLDFERPDTVFACGQGSALVLTERYLHHRSFLHAHDDAVEMAALATAEVEFACAPGFDVTTQQFTH
jgi:hypothetical protein